VPRKLITKVGGRLAIVITRAAVGHGRLVCPGAHEPPLPVPVISRYARADG